MWQLGVPPAIEGERRSRAVWGKWREELLTLQHGEGWGSNVRLTSVSGTVMTSLEALDKNGAGWVSPLSQYTQVGRYGSLSLLQLPPPLWLVCSADTGELTNEHQRACPSTSNEGRWRQYHIITEFGTWVQAVEARGEWDKWKLHFKWRAFSGLTWINQNNYKKIHSKFQYALFLIDFSAVERIQSCW